MLSIKVRVDEEVELGKCIITSKKIIFSLIVMMDSNDIMCVTDEVSHEEVELGSVYEVNHKKLHPRTRLVAMIGNRVVYGKNIRCFTLKDFGWWNTGLVLKNEDIGLAQELKKNEMVRWGVRRQVMYIGRQKEMPKIPSTSSFVQGEKRKEVQHEINCDCEDEDVEVELLDDNVDKKEENDAEVETDQEENGSQAEADKEKNEVEAL
ncbi:hypothetical protein Tco_0783196 [Tanacetum coccineum]